VGYNPNISYLHVSDKPFRNLYCTDVLGHPDLGMMISPENET